MPGFGNYRNSQRGYSMAKKKVSPKKPVAPKKAPKKKSVEKKENVPETLPPFEIKPLTKKDYFFGILKRTFGYE